jgi:hypothetical protein
MLELVGTALLVDWICNKMLARRALIGASAGGLTRGASLQTVTSPITYLSIASANVPSYNTDKMSIFFNLKFEDVTGLKALGGRASIGGTFVDTPFIVFLHNGALSILCANTSGSIFNPKVSLWNPSTGVWYNVLIHLDWANGTQADRCKVWIDRVAQTVSSNSLTGSGTTGNTQDLLLGSHGTGNNTSNSNFYQFYWGSNVLWALDDVTDTSTDQTIDLSTPPTGSIIGWQGDFGQGIEYDWVQGASTWSITGSPTLKKDVPSGVI